MQTTAIAISQDTHSRVHPAVRQIVNFLRSTHGASLDLLQWHYTVGEGGRIVAEGKASNGIQVRLFPEAGDILHLDLSGVQQRYWLSFVRASEKEDVVLRIIQRYMRGD